METLHLKKNVSKLLRLREKLLKEKDSIIENNYFY